MKKETPVVILPELVVINHKNLRFCGHESSSGGLTIIDNTLYVVTQANCINCPVAKVVVQEAIEGSPIQLEIVDLLDMDPNFEFGLLENQVFISSTPSVILENNGALRMLYSGTVPSVEELRKRIGVS